MNSVVISVGGSIIVPDKVDSSFLKNLREIIIQFSKKNKVVLVIGGGKTCRNYNDAASKVRNLTHEELDWLGIEATKLNAFLVKTIFGDIAHGVVYNPTEPIKSNKKIIIASGWKPGCSSDKDATLLAENLGIKTVINMSNIDYVYDKDPKEHKDANPLDEMSWTQLQKLVGTKWIPGMNMPFDPIATKHAKELGLTLYIIGNDIKNLNNLLHDKPFKGTVIK